MKIQMTKNKQKRKVKEEEKIPEKGETALTMSGRDRGPRSPLAAGARCRGRSSPALVRSRGLNINDRAPRRWWRE